MDDTSRHGIALNAAEQDAASPAREPTPASIRAGMHRTHGPVKLSYFAPPVIPRLPGPPLDVRWPFNGGLAPSTRSPPAIARRVARGFSSWGARKITLPPSRSSWSRDSLVGVSNHATRASRPQFPDMEMDYTDYGWKGNRQPTDATIPRGATTGIRSTRRGGGRSALLTKLLPFAGLVALAVRLFGKNRSAETRLAAGKRPEGTRQGHGKDTARSRQGGRPKEVGQKGQSVNC